MSMFMIKNKDRSQKGSVLLEALLSIIILSVGLTALVQSMTSSLRSMAFSSKYTLASILLENKMFEAYQHMFQGEDLDEEGTMEEPNEGYHYRMETHPLDQYHSETLKQFTLRLDWAQRGKTPGLAIETYLFLEPQEQLSQQELDG